ncbi:unnamed protein product [Colias eurytheme]|nr:unnamed protein product [Colias eurytheme]
MQNEKENKSEVELGENEEKTLGLRWLTESDSIAFRANLRNTSQEILQGIKIPTKREITSAVMSTFDPLGLASPVLIQGKKLIQSIWRSGVGWDNQIEPRDYQTWLTYINNMKLLQVLRLNRCIAPYNTEGELHVFTDASETAYAAAVYWRTENNRGEYNVSLIASKARVAPLKPISMPRLELQAALLGSRLAHTIENELDLQVTKKHTGPIPVLCCLGSNVTLELSKHSSRIDSPKLRNLQNLKIGDGYHQHTTQLMMQREMCRMISTTVIGGLRVHCFLNKTHLNGLRREL